MPLPFLPLVAAFVAGNASSEKPKKQKAISGYVKKDGTKVAAYLKTEKGGTPAKKAKKAKKRS